jgi:hypothetical protein
VTDMPAWWSKRANMQPVSGVGSHSSCNGMIASEHQLYLLDPRQQWQSWVSSLSLRLASCVMRTCDPYVTVYNGRRWQSSRTWIASKRLSHCFCVLTLCVWLQDMASLCPNSAPISAQSDGDFCSPLQPSCWMQPWKPPYLCGFQRKRSFENSTNKDTEIRSWFLFRRRDLPVLSFYLDEICFWLFHQNVNLPPLVNPPS